MPVNDDPSNLAYQGPHKVEIVPENKSCLFDRQKMGAMTTLAKHLASAPDSLSTDTNKTHPPLKPLNP